MTAAVVIEQEPDWLIRPYDAATDDEHGMHYLLGISYSRSRAGERAGACHAGRSSQDRAWKRLPERDEVEGAKQKAFLAAHSPIWAWLLRNAEVTLLCDPEKPWIAWAWLITSGPDVLHAIGVKRTTIEQGLGPDVARALLGDRLERHQVCTLELPQMRAGRGGARGVVAVGIDRPRTWSMDSTWLLTRMLAPSTET